MGPLGPSAGPPWEPMGRPWGPMGSQGSPRGPLGAQGGPKEPQGAQGIYFQALLQSSHSLRSNLTFPRVPQRPCPQGPGGHPPIPLPLAFLPISFISPLIPPIPPCPPTLGDLIPVPPISPFKGLMTLGSDLVTIPPL